jgi:hypothetical protein
VIANAYAGYSRKHWVLRICVASEKLIQRFARHAGTTPPTDTRHAVMVFSNAPAALAPDREALTNADRTAGTY